MDSFLFLLSPQRNNAVAQHGGVFEFQHFGRLTHLFFQLRDFLAPLPIGQFFLALPAVARFAFADLQNVVHRLDNRFGYNTVGFVKRISVSSMAARMEGVTTSAYKITFPSAFRAARPMV